MHVPAATYLNEGANLQLVDMTYLHYAAYTKNEVAMRVLLHHGANPYKRCKKSRYEAKSKKNSGPTPLSMYPPMQQLIERYCNYGNKFDQQFANIIIVLDKE